MLLKRVKHNGIEVVVITVVVIIGMALSMFLPAPARSIVAPLDGTPLFDTIYNNVFGGGINMATRIASLVFLFIESFMIILVNSKFEFTRAKPVMFMLVYMLVALSLVPNNSFLPEQIANIFIALGLIKVFSTHGKEKAVFQCFDAGLFFGLASLFCYPAAIMILVGLVGLMIFRPFRGNEFIVYLLGCVTPILFYVVIYYLANGEVSLLVENVVQRFSHAVPRSSSVTMLAVVVHVVIIVLASVMIIGEYSKFNLVSSQSYRVMFVMFVFVVVLCHIPYFGIQTIRMAVLPLSMMYVTVFHDCRHSMWMDTLFYMFLIAYIGTQVLWYR